jgi:hypothetical protein
VKNIYHVKVERKIPSIRKLNGKQFSLTNPEKSCRKIRNQFEFSACKHSQRKAGIQKLIFKV